MQAKYLGRVPFRVALEAQAVAFEEVLAGGSGQVIGFESEKVVTLGLRADEAVDFSMSRARAEAAGFQVEKVDRGGQATVHNPGQLVIFPVLSVRQQGTRAWVCALAKATESCLKSFDFDCRWDEKRPGIYSARGKVAALGVRIRKGVSTHGVAINVRNTLTDFAQIRSCGVSEAVLDQLGGDVPLGEIFSVWTEHFQRQWPQKYSRC